MRKIRIGVMGVANIARRSFIPAIKALPEQFDLVAIASRDEPKAVEAARAFDCLPVVGYEKLVRSDQLDALYIPLPTGLHKLWVNEALLSGKHVYVEKSFAHTLSEAHEMIANARLHNCAAMEGFMFQYHSQHKQVFDLLRANAIGEVRHFAASFGFPPLKPTDFRYDEQLGGGALFDAGAYPVRATHFIMGDSMEVQAATLHVDPRTGSDIFGSAYLADARGVGAAIAYGFDNFYQCRYEIWGSTGKLSATRAFTPGPAFRPEIRIETAQGISVIEAEPDNHFVGALREFHRIIVEPSQREAHYEQILLQSRSLDAIKSLGTSSGNAGR